MLVVSNCNCSNLHLFWLLVQEDASKADAYVKGIMEKINFTTELNNSVKATDLVIEAIVENLDVKVKLFTGIDKVNK